MNKILKKPVFRWLLVVSMATSPVLVIADTIAEVVAQTQTAAMEMPCHQMKHDANYSDGSGTNPTSDPCSCCDQCHCFQIKACHYCPGWVNFTILDTRPLEFAAVGMRKMVKPDGQRIPELNSPPLLRPPDRT